MLDLNFLLYLCSYGCWNESGLHRLLFNAYPIETSNFPYFFPLITQLTESCIVLTLVYDTAVNFLIRLAKDSVRWISPRLVLICIDFLFKNAALHSQIRIGNNTQAEFFDSFILIEIVEKPIETGVFSMFKACVPWFYLKCPTVRHLWHGWLFYHLFFRFNFGLSVFIGINKLKVNFLGK